MPASAMHGDNYGKFSKRFGDVVIACECYSIVSGIFQITSNLDFPERLAE